MWEFIGGLGLGSIFTVLINYFLDKRKIRNERKYQFLKEEALFYKKTGERIIQKLTILENQREKFKIYLEGAIKAFEKKEQFKDVNNTLNKDEFERNQGEIVTLIYIYFNELGEEWNNCSNAMGKIMHRIHLLSINRENWYNMDWQKEIDSFNRINQYELGDKPQKISDKIIKIIREKEEKIANG